MGSVNYEALSTDRFPICPVHGSTLIHGCKSCNPRREALEWDTARVNVIGIKTDEKIRAMMLRIRAENEEQ